MTTGTQAKQIEALTDDYFVAFETAYFVALGHLRRADPVVKHDKDFMAPRNLEDSARTVAHNVALIRVMEQAMSRAMGRTVERYGLNH